MADLTSDQLTLRATNQSGAIEEDVQVIYRGVRIAFLIPSKALSNIVALSIDNPESDIEILQQHGVPCALRISTPDLLLIARVFDGSG